MVISCNPQEFETLIAELSTLVEKRGEKILIVATQEGCPACGEYMRKLDARLNSNNNNNNNNDNSSNSSGSNDIGNIIVIEVRTEETDHNNSCDIILDRLHVMSTPGVFVVDKHGLQPITFTNVRTADEAVEYTLSVLASMSRIT